MEKIVNNGAGKPYYTQRNNRLSPAAACNVTAMIAGLSAAGFDVDHLVPAGIQPEDALLEFLRADERVQRFYRDQDPHKTIPPNEWHPVLCYGTNLWIADKLGVKPVDYHYSMQVRDFVAAIDAGGAVVTSGKFEIKPGQRSGHVVAVTGYHRNNGKLTGFIIDDSWGDYHDYYLTKRGKAIFMSIDDFKKIIRGFGITDKMGHIIRKAA